MKVLTKQINWNKLPMRCHCMSDLLMEPREKAKKEAGELGETAKKRLIKVYALEKWGREMQLRTDPILKGLMQEGIGIDLINELEGEKFQKNEERIVNDFFSGVPDFYKGKEITKAKYVGDNKCAYTLESFLFNELVEKKEHAAQLNCYFSLTGAAKGAVYYTLVNAPLTIIQKHLYKLKMDMGIIDEEASPEYKEAAAEMVFNMTFDDVPAQERLIKVDLEADNDLILKMEVAVVKGREWLADFDEKRLSRYN